MHSHDFKANIYDIAETDPIWGQNGFTRLPNSCFQAKSLNSCTKMGYVTCYNRIHYRWIHDKIDSCQILSNRGLSSQNSSHGLAGTFKNFRLCDILMYVMFSYGCQDRLSKKYISIQTTLRELTSSLDTVDYRLNLILVKNKFGSGVIQKFYDNQH